MTVLNVKDGINRAFRRNTMGRIGNFLLEHCFPLGNTDAIITIHKAFEANSDGLKNERKMLKEAKEALKSGYSSRAASILKTISNMETERKNAFVDGMSAVNIELQKIKKQR